jgi:hypothetical protein
MFTKAPGSVTWDSGPVLIVDASTDAVASA